MRVEGITGKKYAVLFCKMVSKALTDRIGRPPDCIGNLEGVRGEDLASSLVEV
jgi:hypothetical protein